MRTIPICVVILNKNNHSLLIINPICLKSIPMITLTNKRYGYMDCAVLQGLQVTSIPESFLPL